MTSDARQAAEEMRESAAKVAENLISSGGVAYQIMEAILALPLPEAGAGSHDDLIGEGMNNAADFLFEQLAKALKLDSFEPKDGTETWDGDVSATLYGILYAAGVLDEDTNEVGTHATIARLSAENDTLVAGMTELAERAAAALPEAYAKGLADGDPRRLCRRYRHVKRGSTYRYFGAAAAQASEPIKEGDIVTVYQSETDNRLWVRPLAEFEDGRFVEIERTGP